jgi:hypothetical protein
MISIFTSTSNRELYLKRLLSSVVRCSTVWPQTIEHIILFQGEKPSKDFEEFLSLLPSNYSRAIKILHSSVIDNDGTVMNKAKNLAANDLFFKLDDDAKLVSEDYFMHALEIHKLVPNAMFSPYPVGLINNPGGVLSKEHSVKYSQDTDTFYTLRRVNHVGGFAKIIPTEYIKQVNFTNGRQEDTDTSNWCISNGVPMYYLENSLIVEHQESTLGQHERYGKEYFGGRF